MRFWIAGWGVMMAAVLVGCGTPQTREHAAGADNRHETIIDLDRSYLSACRIVLGELRTEFAESAIVHEIWPDIQEASIHISPGGRRGVLVLVTIRATAPDRCRMTIFCTNSIWRERTVPGIEKALKAPPKAPKR